MQIYVYNIFAIRLFSFAYNTIFTSFFINSCVMLDFANVTHTILSIILLLWLILLASLSRGQIWAWAARPGPTNPARPKISGFGLAFYNHWAGLGQRKWPEEPIGPGLGSKFGPKVA
jgi:hypothetical protein